MLRASKLAGHMCHGATADSCGWEYTHGGSRVRMWSTSPAGKRTVVDMTKFGAHVIHWQEAGRPPMVYMSKTAIMDKTKPIRGGVPVLFPQFGNVGPLKKAHGFGRIADWDVDESQSVKHAESGDVQVVFTLKTSAFSKQHWDHEFQCAYKVKLSGGQLLLELTVTNLGPSTMSFTSGFHPYFEVSDINKVSVLMDSDVVKLTGPMDKRHIKCTDEVTLVDPGYGRSLQIKKYGLEDLCIWTPWENHKNFADLSGYKTFLCVEPIQVGRPIVLQQGGSWRGGATHTVQYSA